MKNHWLQQRMSKLPVRCQFLLMDRQQGHTILDVPVMVTSPILPQSICIESTDVNFVSFVNNHLTSLVYATPPKPGCDANLRVYDHGKLVEEWGLIDLTIMSYSHNWNGGTIMAGMTFTSPVIKTIKSGYFTIS